MVVYVFGSMFLKVIDTSGNVKDVEYVVDIFFYLQL